MSRRELACDAQNSSSKILRHSARETGFGATKIASEPDPALNCSRTVKPLNSPKVILVNVFGCLDECQAVSANEQGYVASKHGNGVVNNTDCRLQPHATQHDHEYGDSVCTTLAYCYSVSGIHTSLYCPTSCKLSVCAYQ